MSYAKGKWKTEEMGGHIEITTTYRQRDSKVCIAKVEVDFGDPFNQEQIDSAKLIASAPALLEALEELLHGTFPDGVDDDGSGRIGFSDACVKRYKKALAAIAAARGTV